MDPIIQHDHVGIIIQTSGIFIALIFVVVSYRVNSLKKLMVGQGNNILFKALEGQWQAKSQKKGEYEKYIPYFPYYIESLEVDELPEERENKEIGKVKLTYNTYLNRLSGSIKLEEIYGIEEIIVRFTKAELMYYNRERVPRGFAEGALPLFLITKRHRELLQWSGLMLISIFTALIILSLCTRVSGWGWGSCYISVLILTIAISLLLFAVALIKKVGQEKYKKSQVEKLIKGDNDILEIYKESTSVRKQFK